MSGAGSCEKSLKWSASFFRTNAGRPCRGDGVDVVVGIRGTGVYYFDVVLP